MELEEVENLPETLRGKVVLAQRANKILMKFTKKQIERYSRQIILKKIGVIGQKKLIKSLVF